MGDDLNFLGCSNARVDPESQKNVEGLLVRVATVPLCRE